ncbi:hypothetical protein F6V25_08035 [Oryzomonas japonica]|uniref:Bacteriophage T7 tail fibre protein-like N-terminal domain-containing protein n=1 Tax=Oryzomonas japonica TaxID=2603858 RepID=A0A7J4ZR50_9BACT|nr:hypothetical protein [Oryzomonas japonica]KAB0665662.1 hypothetical protein F6V25_08035 [Oryzomonas japonica]
MIEQQEIYFSYLGNGVIAQFAYGCRIFEANDLRVSVDGVVKALGVDYTITGIDDVQGGEVTFVAAAIPVNGAVVELQRVLSYKRAVSYIQNGDFRPQTVDADQDYQTALLQQMEFTLRRVLLVPPDANADDLTLPPLATRKSKLLGFDINGKFGLFDASYTVVVQQGIAEAATLIRADASAGPVNIDLPESGEVVVIKTDDTANPVIIIATGGKTILRQASVELSVQDEALRLKADGMNWYRV